MGGLCLFALTITVVIMMVRIGAIVLELTGMNWEQAKFQALSCFTLTGFTTSEASLVTRHPQRRKIAASMMVLGYAGSISLVATFVNFLRPIFEMHGEYHISLINVWIPDYLFQLGRLAALVIFLLIICKFFSKSKLWEKISLHIRERIRKSNLIGNVTFEDMAIGAKGYGIIRIAVTENDEFTGKTIAESGFKNITGAQILTIERESKVMPNPKAEEKIMTGDIIYCFGMRKKAEKNTNKKK